MHSPQDLLQSHSEPGPMCGCLHNYEWKNFCYRTFYGAGEEDVQGQGSAADGLICLPRAGTPVAGMPQCICISTS